MTTIEHRDVPPAVLNGVVSASDRHGSGPAAARQIAALRHLPDGWRNGEGITFDTGYLDWLADAFARLYPPSAPAPTICPTTYGIVSLEWSLPDAEISLEIDPETRQVELVWANAHSANSGEIAIDLAEGWAGLVDCLTRFTGVQR